MAEHHSITMLLLFAADAGFASRDAEMIRLASRELSDDPEYGRAVDNAAKTFVKRSTERAPDLRIHAEAIDFAFRAGLEQGLRLGAAGERKGGLY